MNKLKLLVLLLPLVLVACNKRAEAITPLPSPLPSSTPAPSHMPTPTTRPTATWLPPLPVDEAVTKFIGLLRDNGGCRLPCFLGMVPGETTYDSYVSFKHQFVNIRSGGMHLLGKDSEIRILLDFGSTDSPDMPIDSIFVSIWTDDPEINNYNDYVYDDPLFIEYFHYYTLSELLATYGEPSRIWVSVDFGSISSPGGTDNILISIDYLELGWGAVFRMPIIEEGEFYGGCPAQAFPSIYIWSSEDPAEAAANLNRLQSGFFYLPVEDAMSINVEEFYQQFRAPNHDECLETPKDVWPWE